MGFDATAAPVQAGPVRLFIGKRSDPFFADAEGVLHWLVDGQKGDLPVDRVPTPSPAPTFYPSPWRHPTTCSAPGRSGPGSPSACAATACSCRWTGSGNPSFNPILNADDIKDEFNATDPVDDVKNYLQPLSEALQRHGYAPDEADGCGPHPAARHSSLRPHQACPLP